MFVSPSSSSINFQSVVSPIPPPRAWCAGCDESQSRCQYDHRLSPPGAHNRFTDNFQTDNLIFIELSQLLSGKGLRGADISDGENLLQLCKTCTQHKR